MCMTQEKTQVYLGQGRLTWETAAQVSTPSCLCFEPSRLKTYACALGFLFCLKGSFTTDKCRLLPLLLLLLGNFRRLASSLWRITATSCWNTRLKKIVSKLNNIQINENNTYPTTYTISPMPNTSNPFSNLSWHAGLNDLPLNSDAKSLSHSFNTQVVSRVIDFCFVL